MLCFNLAVGSNGFGLNVDYSVVKDFCEKYSLDSILVLSALKQAVTKISEQHR